MLALLKFLFFSLLFFLVFMVIWVKFAPGEQITPVFKGTPLEKIACNYPVKIASSSMAPVFQEDQIVFFNKCISDKNNLSLKTIIVFNAGDILRVGIIRNIREENDQVFYEVSPASRPDDITNVYPSSIVALWAEKL